jgi:antitoxin CptB
VSELSNLEEIKKLRWRCRRGTLELDLMLVRYLDRCYLEAASDEQQTFRELLELEDSDLLRYMLGEQRPENPTLARLVELIRILPVS